jgi:hypothetical protein
MLLNLELWHQLYIEGVTAGRAGGRLAGIMPSPIAHLGVGYAIYRHYKDRLPEDKRSFWKFPLQLILVTGLSMLPDLDVIPAIIFRDMRAYHNNISHSLLFGIPVALWSQAFSSGSIAPISGCGS